MAATVEETPQPDPPVVWVDTWTPATVQKLYTNRVFWLPQAAATAPRISPLCESGGTGRRARLRISWATVGVRVPPLAPSPRSRRRTSRPESIRKLSAMTMNVEVTELGPMKRALKIEVPAQEVTQRFSRAYTELNRQVQVPGFRPGKAPLAILEQRYAKAVEEDVIRSLVPDFYDRAIKQAGISPVLVEIPPLERVKIKKDA